MLGSRSGDSSIQTSTEESGLTQGRPEEMKLRLWPRRATPEPEPEAPAVEARPEPEPEPQPAPAPPDEELPAKLSLTLDEAKEAI